MTVHEPDAMAAALARLRHVEGPELAQKVFTGW
jgi:hypothetical protein